ncbi:MAG TPA: hypothetical protein VMF31_07760 [Solirubrobacterales bacterium]|nr:hypothetical protein [Solirubrobacterales bacterium]
MKKRKNGKPSLSTVIAALALFIVLGGTATAASGLINGKKIKKGTVTAKQIKNKTITKGKLKPALVKSLKGQTGPQGPKGAAGENGVVTPIYKEFGSVNLPANSEFAIGTLDLPAGKYLVTGTTFVTSLGTSSVSCALNANGQFSENAAWNSPVPGSRTTLPLQMITGDGATQVTMGCNPGNSIGAASGTIIATPVQ